MSYIEAFSDGFLFEIEGKVTQYPYRTAMVHDRFMELERDSDELRDTLKTLETQLAEAAKANVDNHTVYEVTLREGKSVYIMFSDMRVYFGLTVDKRRS